MNNVLVIKGADFSEVAIGEYISEDMVTIKSGKYILLSDGSEAELSSWKSTDFYEIPNGFSVIRGNTNGYYTVAAVAFYDSSHNYISGDNGGAQGGAGTVLVNLNTAIPSNAKYIKLSWQFGGGTDVDLSFPSLYFK